MRLIKRKKHEPQIGRNPRDGLGKTAPVFSYYSKRADDIGDQQKRNFQGNQAKRIDKKRLVWLAYLPSILSIVIVFAAALYLTTLSYVPKVIIASNPKQPAVLQPTDVYEKSASELMKGSIFNRSKLSINSDKFAKQLESQFPELGDIVVTIPLIGRRLIVETRPARPAIILVGNGGSFVIDEKGRPVLKANQLASSVRNNLPIVSDSSDTQIEIGKQIVTTEFVAFVQIIQTQLNSKSIKAESYTLPTLESELRVKLAGKGYYIKFNTEADARSQVGTYFAVSERLDSQGIVPGEYVDVRVEERAYYR